MDAVRPHLSLGRGPGDPGRLHTQLVLHHGLVGQAERTYEEGAISGQQARRLAHSAGSIWKRIVTDPLTGRAIEATAGT